MMSLYVIALTSHKLHGVWTHRHFDCLFNNLFSLTTKISMHSITSGFPSQRASKAESQGVSDSWYHMRESTESLCNKSSGWHNETWTHSHPDDLAIGSISSGWPRETAVCHPDDLRYCPMSFEWHNIIWTLSHPDELTPGFISSGWLKETAVCHPDDLTSFEP